MTQREYRSQLGNESCELSQHLVGVKEWENLCQIQFGVRGRAAANRLCRSGVEVHHIIHGTSRVHATSNMIALHPLTHKQWGHDTCPRELLVGCLMVKSRKGELDWGVLNAIAGKNVQGMIEGYELGEPFDCWRKELTA